MGSRAPSPTPPELKTHDDFFEVWGGIAGGQSTLQLMLTAGYGERNMPLQALATVCSGNAARRFGLTGKGRLEPGADADLTLVDLGHDRVLDSRRPFPAASPESLPGAQAKWAGRERAGPGQRGLRW
ncbi:MAG: amidohydrolase family protein [Rubrobacteraceae bacterium]